MQMLDHVEYRLVTGGEDLEISIASAISLSAVGHVRAHRQQDVRGSLGRPAELLPVRHLLRRRLVSTLRLHYVTREYPYSPSVDAYPEILVDRLARGETFIDGTRFATDPSNAPVPGVLPFLTLRLGMVAYCYFRQTAMLIPIKVEHSAFYVRFFNAKQRTEGKEFPGVLYPIALFEIPCDQENFHRLLERLPFFRSTPMEQRLTFGDPAINKLTPRSIFPTAKYLSDAA